MEVGMANRTSNIDVPFVIQTFFAYLNAYILELAKSGLDCSSKAQVYRSFRASCVNYMYYT